jgi:hypothetical protein
MSYQPYPTSGQMPEPQQRPTAPNSVQTAVKLMYAGAALSLIGVVVSLATVGNLKSAIVTAGNKAGKHYTASQIHAIEVASIAFLVISAIIGIGLWLWMARASASGHNYARIVGSVLFALNTLLLLSDLVRPHAGIGLIFAALVWLAGLGAVVMLWRKESSEFFNLRAR